MAQNIVINPDGSITETDSQQVQSGVKVESSPTFYDTDSNGGNQSQDDLLREYGMNPNAGDPVTTEDPDPPDLPSPGEQIQDYYDGLESDPVNESQPEPSPPPAPEPDPTPDLDNTTNGPDAGGETNGSGTASGGREVPALLIAAAVIVAVVAQGVMN